MRHKVAWNRGERTFRELAYRFRRRVEGPHFQAMRALLVFPRLTCGCVNLRRTCKRRMSAVGSEEEISKGACHSEYCSFHCAIQPSGTLGGGGPAGGRKSAMKFNDNRQIRSEDACVQLLKMESNKMEERKKGKDLTRNTW